MKKLFVVTSLFCFLLTGCLHPSGNGSSYDSSSSSFGSSKSSYSYSFPTKEDGLTLNQITEEANKLPAQERVKVRYSWHIDEKLTGTFPMTMADGSDMQAGDYALDFVTEPKQHNLDTNIKIISGTPVTKNQKYFASYSSSVTVSGWLSYHSNRRTFLESAQEGEGFEERFYTGPLTLWMMIWGVRFPNATVDGAYFSYEEFERAYNEEGYCTAFKIKEFNYLKGTLSGFLTGTHDYDGTYEYSATCTIEYLE